MTSRLPVLLFPFYLRFALLIGTFAVAAFGPGAGYADTEERYDMPFVAVKAGDNPTQMDLNPDSGPLKPVYAFDRADGSISGKKYTASAAAHIAFDPDLNFNKIRKNVTAHSVLANAIAQAYVAVEVIDPQHRVFVKVVVKYTAGAGFGDHARSDWELKFGVSGGNMVITRHPDGTIRSMQWPYVEEPAYLRAEGTCFYSVSSIPPCNILFWEKGQFTDPIRVPDHMQGDNRSIDVTLRPGDNYMLSMVASSSAVGGSGVAHVDPIVLPHADNPDVVVNMRAAEDPTPRPPLAGLTAEQLEAEGLDIKPLLALGLFGQPAPADSLPPTTVATPSIAANANGWNNGPVTVTLASTDNAGGSGVKEIHTTLAGASTGTQVVSGSSANVAVAAEGVTTLTYFAVDNAGNQEAPKTLTLRIDRTPPAIRGMPAADCTLWPPDHRLVEVAVVTASDALSGLAPGMPEVTAASNEPATASGSGDTSPDIVIAGGHVQLRAERAGTGSGRIYTITARASDLAGNTATVTGTCTVPHDRR